MASTSMTMDLTSLIPEAGKAGLSYEERELLCLFDENHT